MSEYNIDEEFDSFGKHEQVGPNRLVVKLQQAFRTEVHAPTILPYEEELVKKIKDELEKQMDQLENYDDNVDDSANSEKDRISMRFWRTLMLMDLERVRYSLTRYLRCRIKKIENSLEFIARDVESRDRLSLQEITLLEKLNELKNNHVKAVVLDKLADIGPVEMIDYRLENAKPNEKEFVFARALQNIDIGQTPVKVGEIVICQYNKIKEYVERNIDERELELI